ncbi:MAG: hypothetical protein ACXWID_14010, partial [Pyrinomonadaceae bacterium]
GLLIQWLYPRTPVYVWRVPGVWFDIGSKETLEEANGIFSRADVRELTREGFVEKTAKRLN